MRSENEYAKVTPRGCAIIVRKTLEELFIK